MSNLTTSPKFPAFPPPGFLGAVLRAGDQGYDEARSLPNVRVGGAPALIARCTSEEDVLLAVRFCFEHKEPLAIRGGGHSLDGHAMPDGAFVIDMSLMNKVDVDPATGRATVEAGALIRDMDAATQKHGLAVPSGTVSHTGVAGLTLGGGLGFLTRLHGMAADNVLAVDVITVDGRQLTASKTRNSDLFWGIRGAGHNLAIVTKFVMQAHPIGPDVMSGHIIYPIEAAPEILSQLHHDLQKAPREVTIYPVLLPAPEFPGVPKELAGIPIMVFVTVYVGKPEDYQRTMDLVLPATPPIVNEMRPSTWMEANSMIDVLTPPGRRQHHRGGYLATLTAEMVQQAVDLVRCAPTPTAPGPSIAIAFPCLGGANDDTAEDEMAYSRENAFWLYETYASYVDASEDKMFGDWVEQGKVKLGAHSLSNSYVNLSSDNSPSWLSKVYGAPKKWERLCRLKTEYDPENRLCYNKNITKARLALAGAAVAQTMPAPGEANGRLLKLIKKLLALGKSL